jgi:hypothetical protein
LEAIAFLCFNLLSELHKRSIKRADRPPPNTPNNNYFPPKKRKKKRRKKRYAYLKARRAGGCQGFLSEYYPTKGR